jgi:hypothetical protein
MPEDGYTRPPQVDPTGLIVVHVTEDGASRQAFDFSDLECPPELLRSLVQGFARAVSQGGRWRAVASARNGARDLRRFVRYVAKHDPPLSRIDDLGPEVWWSWRSSIESSNRYPTAVFTIRGLLMDTSGVPELTFKAMQARFRKPKSRMYVAYSREEFNLIRKVALGIVRTAQQRIDANVATLDAYRNGDEPAESPRARVRGTTWSAGALLDHLALTGKAPPGTFGGGTRGECRELLNLEGATAIHEALFPNSTEMLSLAFLLTCACAYNPSVIKNLTINTDRADDRTSEAPVHVVHLDKPRRGPAARFSDESLTGRAARVIDRAVTLTEQARKTMTLLGTPTDSLVLYRAGAYYGDDGSNVFRTNLDHHRSLYLKWNTRADLKCDDGTPLTVTFQRLRLTEQVLNSRPRQNSASVSESVYRQPDQQTRREAASVILRGQSEALEHARVTVQMRALTDSDVAEALADPTALAQRLGVPPEKIKLLLSGGLNTATGACLDFANSPFAEREGEPCRASFIACLGCRNAVATPAHLPRLVALSGALERIGSAVTPAVWDEDYAVHHARLTELLETNTTVEQRAAALRATTAADEESILRLLARGLDV